MVQFASRLQETQKKFMNKISMKKGSEKREDSIYNKWFKEFNNEVKLSSNMTLTMCIFFLLRGVTNT